MFESIAHTRMTRRRRKAQKLASQDSMRNYLATALPHPNHAAWQCDYLVLDLEMSGLDPEQNHILSAGWVVIENGQICHDSAQHHYVASNEAQLDLSESGPIHKISHTVLSSGKALNTVLDALLFQLGSRVLVVHHAPLDMRFLNTACEQIYGVRPYCLVIDTLRNEQLKLSRQNRLDGASLRLHDCRQRYNLPSYQAHNAVIDALATAELWLAQLTYAGPNGGREDLRLRFFG
ncbi:DNA polymerase III subunit epsilon [Arenicella chitinivorans]|uniref:DNA polymerase III subunit epsilon n=1 Tax=Arenicella chitinivorans TaxID=1329800 RepID=A0A918RLN2_9GAMM|nr:exonuclease domain-containing protein [Arenicella chitinivorans]GHA01247.1 DNA polymerase III subunit epsilon [Arenicella chitinivorans]